MTKKRERLFFIYVQVHHPLQIKAECVMYRLFLSNRYFVFDSNVTNTKPCIVAKLLFSAQKVYVQTALGFNCILWVRILVVQL